MSEFESIKDEATNTELSQEFLSEHIQYGEALLAWYKGKTLFGLSGESTDEQALSRGHFGGISAGIMALFILLQKLLNQHSSIDPELVPVMKKTPKGMFWVTDPVEAMNLGKKYKLAIVQKWEEDEHGRPYLLESEKNKYYYDYQGYSNQSYKLAKFAYDVARGSASYQGETKQTIATALSNLKAVPVFPPTMVTRPAPELYTGGDKDAD